MRLGRMQIKFMVGGVLTLLLQAGSAFAVSPLKAGGLVSYPVPVVGPNLLKNPGFETQDPTTRKPTEWIISSAFTADGVYRRTGAGSLCLKDAPLYPYSESARQTVYLKKGSYRISGWMKLDGLGTSTQGVRLSLAGAGSTAVISGTSDWQQVSTEKIAVTQDGNYTFKVEAYSEPTGTAWFDDLELRRESLPVEAFLLYPNYRGMLFDDQSQIIRLDVNVDPPEGSLLQDYVIDNSLVDEESGTIIDSATRIADAKYVQSFDGAALQNGKTYLLKTRLLKTTDNSLVYEYPSYRISKVQGAVRANMTVSYDENNRFLVRGEPTFWLGVYDSGMGYPATEAQWETQLASSRRLFELPINLYNNYWYGTISQTSVQALMNVLQKRGILYLQTGNAFAGTYNNTSFRIDTDDTFLSTISANPGLGGFYTVDEAIPDLAPTMFKQYERLRSFKPDGVTFGALLNPNSVSYWRDTVDMLSMDPYPLVGAEPTTGYPLNLVSDYTAATRKAVMDSRPTVTVLQFFQGTSNSRWPTRNELRNMSYMAITEGSNGVVYWSLGARALDYVCTGWCAEKVAHFENLKAVMNELKALEPALTSIDRPELLAGNTNPAAIRTRVKSVNGKAYLFAYNYTAAATSATFGWAEAADSVNVYAEGRAVSMSGMSFSDTFAPYQAHVYEITDTLPPTASIASPGIGVVVNGTAAVNISADDKVGVSKVDMLVDGINVATDISAPYTFAWNTTTVANGSHILTAKVYDMAGNVGVSAPVTLTVNNAVADTTPPTVSVTSPAVNAIVGGIVAVSAAASDNIGVSRVEFYVDGVLRTTSQYVPYSFTLDTRLMTNGAHTIAVKAYDAAGNVGQSTGVTVTVNNDRILPTVAITSPVAGAVIRGTTTVNVTAADNVAVSKVELLINGKVAGTRTAAPYSFSWASGSYPIGACTLVAYAYDSAGNRAQSFSVGVTVQDSVAPAVTVAAPLDNATIGSSTTITASATDNVEVTTMRIFIDGVLMNTVNSNSFSWVWNSSWIAAGKHRIVVRAYDTAGNTRSRTITVYK